MENSVIVDMHYYKNNNAFIRIETNIFTKTRVTKLRCNGIDAAKEKKKTDISLKFRRVICRRSEENQNNPHESNDSYYFLSFLSFLHLLLLLPSSNITCCVHSQSID